MDDIKFTLILVYYDRPRMVRFMLNSIKEQEYQNFHLVFIDDGSKTPGKLVVQEVLGDELGNKLAESRGDHEDFDFYSRTTLIRLHDTPDQKRAQGGSRHPAMMNYGVLKTPGMRDEDVVVICCDDDSLRKSYLKELNEYYKANPEVLYSFSHVIPYDPLVEAPTEALAGRDFWLNRGKDIPSAFNMVDSSQVTYRRSCFTSRGVRYPEKQFRALDAALYHQLAQIDICRYNGITGQFKGSFQNQLSHRITEEDIYNPVDTELI